jgi:hypothetical protein
MSRGSPTLTESKRAMFSSSLTKERPCEGVLAEGGACVPRPIVANAPISR